jgi:hypothetical protein
MKKIVLVFGLILLLGAGAAFALESQDGRKLSGPHYQFNIIGHPKNVECISGDNSNGRAIMVPLRNVGGPSELVCSRVSGPQNVFVDDTPTWSTQAPTGARIYFQCGPSFDIIDRDGCDSNGAKIQVECTLADDPLSDDPADLQKVIAYDVYIRVLGKPNTCMNITGYAFQQDDLHTLWFQTGTVYLNRSTGKSTFVKATDLFDVYWCDVREVAGDEIGNDNGICETGEECACTTDPVELSVFNDIFDEYFWNIINDGTRLVQVRLYPKVVP